MKGRGRGDEGEGDRSDTSDIEHLLQTVMELVVEWKSDYRNVCMHVRTTRLHMCVCV